MKLKKANMKSYLITDSAYYSQEPIFFTKKLESVFKKHHVDFACFRDKNVSLEQFFELAKLFVDVCNKNLIKNIIIHTHYEIAKELNVKIIHLSSKNINLLPKIRELGLEVIVSTHSLDELKLAKELKANYATFGPIFETPNKGEPKGLDVLVEVVSQIDIPIFALGGIITKQHVEILKKTNVFGFASIRYFLE